MDNKRKKSHTESGYEEIRPGSSYGTRRVNNYGHRTSLEQNVSKRNFPDENEKKRKLEARRKKERLRLARIRAAVALFALMAVTVVLMFMTPLFNIKEIHLEGNELVTKNDIEAKIGDLIGANLFSTSAGDIEKRMLEIPLVQSVETVKNIFPAYLTVKITECPPAAYMLSGNTLIVIDSDLKVIDDSGTFGTEEIPSISGVSVATYELDKTISTESGEKNEILKSLLKTLERVGLINKITYISIDDITSIKFNYENRIEVLCGSQLELDRKIRMFYETINSEEMSPNSMGTIDLSVPGQAVYTP